MLAGVSCICKEECCQKNASTSPFVFCSYYSGWKYENLVFYTIASALENGYLSLFIATLIRSSPCLPSSTCALQLWLLYFSGKQLWERGTIKECFFLFFFLILLNYSPPKSLVAGQDTPRHNSNAFKSWPTRLTLWEVSAVIETSSIRIANRVLGICGPMRNDSRQHKAWWDRLMGFWLAVIIAHGVNASVAVYSNIREHGGSQRFPYTKARLRARLPMMIYCMDSL